MVLGRATDCEVVVPGPSVSGRHARLRWEKGELLLEDLSSANGTFVDGERIATSKTVRIGQDVRLGVEMLPWDEQKLRTFLRHGASDTIVAKPRFGRYRCPQCKKVALVPLGFKQDELSCTHCGSAVLFGQAKPSLVKTLAMGTFVAVSAVLLVSGLFSVAPFNRMLLTGTRKSDEGKVSGSVAPLVPEGPELAPSRTRSDMSPEEQSIRASGSAGRVMLAMDASNPITRNLAAHVASKAEGPFHVEQVAAIWLHVRAGFRYVNDPRGSEYFAHASETISNGFAGDCDDFATALGGMMSAIGGRVRVVMMDGPRGGHAYAEVCMDAVANDIAKRLRRYVRAHWDRRLGPAPSMTNTYYRSDDSCPVWLNLDWNANVPGGPYGDERWAVSIETDGATETLTPADAPASTAKPRR